jgi:hypothetical protein
MQRAILEEHGFEVLANAPDGETVRRVCEKPKLNPGAKPTKRVFAASKKATV